MYNLIKNNIIQFDKIIIDKYFALNIDEVDAIILIRLNDLLCKGERLLCVKCISSRMKIDENECAERIVNLVQAGFIALELSDSSGKEIFNLDETYRRLSYLLKEDEQTKVNAEQNERIKHTVRLLENEMDKTLSPIEMELVSSWYIKKGYSNKQIEEGIFNALANKSRSVAYIDRLISRKEAYTSGPQKKTGTRVQDLFRKVYAKSK